MLSAEYLRGPEPSLGRFDHSRLIRAKGPSRKTGSRVLAVAAAILMTAFAGCAGLPTFPSSDAAGSGSLAENGAAQPGSDEGQAAPILPDAAVPLDTTAVDGASQALDDVPAPMPAELPAGPRVGWLVHFPVETDQESMKKTAQDRGGVFVFALKTLPVAYVLASEPEAKQISQDGRVVRIEREGPLQFHDAESRLAVRIPAVIHPVTGLKDAAGNQIDGRGVGVAVVDTGIYALHADLPYAPTTPGGVVAANLKVESLQYIPMPDTDTTSGHGTHVAAIIAGQGVTDPAMKGMAPGARLYGLGIGEAATNVWAAQAFDWIAQNHATVNPPIRVVSNSWSTGTTYDPNSAITQFVTYLVDQGIVMVFSAGNLGGNGATVQTSGQCQIPKAGVVCVAAFDDLGTGTKNGVIAPYSSRGASAHPSTWPDLSAPGTNVHSARPPVGYITGTGVASYVQLSGTSQSAPHVAGIVALMLQKNGALTPSQVESRLESSAYKFTDGGAYSASGHMAKGAGLADAYAAVSAA